MPVTMPKIRLVFIPLHMLGAFALFCGCTKELGAFCTSEQVMPWIFLAPPCLLVIALLIHMNLYALDFLVEWEAPADAAARKKYGSFERAKKVQTVFQAQTRRIYCQLAWTSALTIALVTTGFIYVQKTGHVSCSPDGSSWRFADMQFSMWFYAAILFVTYVNSCVLRVAFVKRAGTPSLWSWIKGIVFGDIIVHFSKDERFESDDSDAEPQAVLDTQVPDTERPLNNEEKVHYEFQKTPVVIQNKSVSVFVKGNNDLLIKSSSPPVSPNQVGLERKDTKGTQKLSNKLQHNPQSHRSNRFFKPDD
jgi:hypothetical protein